MTTWTSRKAHKSKRAKLIDRVVETRARVALMRQQGIMVAACPMCEVLVGGLPSTACPACSAVRVDKIYYTVQMTWPPPSVLTPQYSAVRTPYFHQLVGELENSGYLVVVCPECSHQQDGQTCPSCFVVKGVARKKFLKNLNDWIFIKFVRGWERERSLADQELHILLGGT